MITESSCQPRTRRPLHPVKNEVTRLREHCEGSADFLRMLDEHRVPFKAQRLMLSALEEIGIPKAHYSPRFAARLSFRFIQHLEFAVMVATVPDFPGPTTRGVAHALFDLLRAFDIHGCTRADRLLAADLLQLASCLEKIATRRWGR